MQKTIKRHALWVLYFAFVSIAMITHDGDPIFTAGGVFQIGKTIIWVILLSFLAYSLYCSSKENIFHTLKETWHYHWHRQIGLDLYIGLLTPLVIIYLHEGSYLVMALWILPILLFANLAVLLYLALNYQSLVSNFLL